MKKEILIVTGILIFIAILIFNCQRYLDHVTENMSNQLKGIRNQTISFSLEIVYDNGRRNARDVMGGIQKKPIWKGI